MLPTEVADPAVLKFSKIFGNFYRHLFRVLPRTEFGFLHDVFERFVIEDWPGLIRGQHRSLPRCARRAVQVDCEGETIVDAHINVGFNFRGIEWLA